MEIRIGAVDLHGFVPHHRLHAQLWLPVEFHEGRTILGIEETEGVNPETLHEPQGARNGAVRHHPLNHVHALGRQRDEIPEIVMRGLGLRKVAVGLRLHGVNKIGKLDRVLDEEDGNVVADEIPIAFLRCISSPRNPRTSRARSDEPLLPATVEKRTKAGVFSPTRWKRSARVTSASESVSWKKPCAP